MHRFITILILFAGIMILVAACTTEEGAVFDTSDLASRARETADVVIMAYTDTPTPLPTNTPQPTFTPTVEVSYPSEQVAAGHIVYQGQCAACHGADFEGGIGPKLITLYLRYHGTAQGLFTYVSGQMPQNNPGSLTDQQYYDVVSYLLWYNEITDGTETIGPDNADSIPLQ